MALALAGCLAHRPCTPSLLTPRPPTPVPLLPGRSFVVLQRKDPEAASRLAGQAQEHILLRHERLKRMAEEGEQQLPCLLCVNLLLLPAHSGVRCIAARLITRRPRNSASWSCLCCRQVSAAANRAVSWCCRWPQMVHYTAAAQALVGYIIGQVRGRRALSAALH